MRIPEITRESIDAWAESARPVGGFVQAVLENNLREAFARADRENTAAMHDIVSYRYNEIPGLCWGSPERVAEWPDEIDRLRALTAKLNRSRHVEKMDADTD